VTLLKTELSLLLHTLQQTPKAFQWVQQPPKIAASRRGIWTTSNTWFLRPTRLRPPNGISIGSAVYAELTNETNRQTDHATPSVETGRIYSVATAVMQPIKDLQTPFITAVIQPSIRKQEAERQNRLRQGKSFHSKYKKQSKMSNYAAGAATWHTGQNICITFDSGPFTPLCKSMTSSTTPKVHNVLHCCQRRTKKWPQITYTLYRKFGEI